MKLNLGAGPDKLDGFLSVDIRPGADITLDLEARPWPWGDNSVDEIMAEHIIEHLRDFAGFVNECHRITKRGGTLTIVTPNPTCEWFWQDPSHIRGYTPNTFMLYCVGVEGTEHCGVIPWASCECYEGNHVINGVHARITKAILTK